MQDFVLDMRERGLAPSTIRNRFVPLRQVLAFAVAARAIPHNPALEARLPTNKVLGRQAYEPHFLSEDQVATLSAAMEFPNDRLVMFMAYTGLRIGEVAGLQIADLDLLRKQITVHRTLAKIGGGWEQHVPKSGKARRVPLPAWLADDMRDYLERHPRNDEPIAPLWPARQNGGVERMAGAKGAFEWDRPWSPGPFRRAFKLALEECDLPATVRLHDLRQVYVSLCASAGVPLYRIAEYAGHAHEGITRSIYTHLFDRDTAADMALLGRPREKVAGGAPSNQRWM